MPQNTHFYLQFGSQIPQQSLKEKVLINQLMEDQSRQLIPSSKATGEDESPIHKIQPLVEASEHSISEANIRPRTVGAVTADKPRRGLTMKQTDEKQLNMDKITPEQAAQIVKRFILPMFDNTKKLAPKNLQ